MPNNNSIKLHRVIKTTPEKVFRAFADADAKASWLPPYGFVCTVQEHAFREGSGYKMAFTNFTTGSRQSFGGTFTKITPNEYIQYSDTFDDPNLPGTMNTMVTLKAVPGGTELTIIQENIPEMIPASMCYLGWQESLEKLIKLVEPNIPDA
ncbi:MAG TPA: SRPBCC family protein [Candidatus Paceibacterota bacterium]